RMNTATRRAMIPWCAMDSRVHTAPATSHGATEVAGVRKCRRSYTCGISHTPRTHRSWTRAAPPRSTATSTCFPLTASVPALEEPDHHERCPVLHRGEHEREVEVDRAVERLCEHDERERGDRASELEAEHPIDDGPAHGEA